MNHFRDKNQLFDSENLEKCKIDNNGKEFNYEL